MKGIKLAHYFITAIAFFVHNANHGITKPIKDFILLISTTRAGLERSTLSTKVLKTGPVIEPFEQEVKGAWAIYLQHRPNSSKSKFGSARLIPIPIFPSRPSIFIHSGQPATFPLTTDTLQAKAFNFDLSPACPFLFAHRCRCYLFFLFTVDCRYFAVTAASMLVVAAAAEIVVVAYSTLLSIASSRLISVAIAYAPSLYPDCVLNLRCSKEMEQQPRRMIMQVVLMEVARQRERRGRTANDASGSEHQRRSRKKNGGGSAKSGVALEQGLRLSHGEENRGIMGYGFLAVTRSAGVRSCLHC
ncbi:hypothetical protein PIB30_060649 [Stylosanthes scabra]|uniref:Uncharacterized protein n=1 Tax=Stylosanthes scabra TaxID=79078 RepID=A0ABU6TN13_9FABA|nr:hypothetical protein [Stylosanthes scabra]